MKSNRQARKQAVDDEGVSPVIAVILMVAITVVLAATVYVWVSGFASNGSGPESASATAKGLDEDNNGDVDTIRVTLVSGENAPYTFECSNDDCSSTDSDTTWDSASEAVLSGSLPGGQLGTDDVLRSVSATSPISDGSTWSVGETLFIACGGSGNAAITASVGAGSDKTTILDTTISCDE